MRPCNEIKSAIVDWVDCVTETGREYEQSNKKCRKKNPAKRFVGLGLKAKLRASPLLHQVMVKNCYLVS